MAKLNFPASEIASKDYHDKNSPTVDLTYSSESENAQSGKAVSQAVDGSVPKKKMLALGAPFSSVLAVDNTPIYTQEGTNDVPNANSYQYIDAVPYGVWVDIPDYKGTIPIRDDNGNLFTGKPKNDVDCANKAYVDDLVGDIDSALTELHNYAQTLIGGNS